MPINYHRTINLSFLFALLSHNELFYFFICKIHVMCFGSLLALFVLLSCRQYDFVKRYFSDRFYLAEKLSLCSFSVNTYICYALYILKRV